MASRLSRVFFRTFLALLRGEVAFIVCLILRFQKLNFNCPSPFRNFKEISKTLGQL
jgi:hypothetical protein